MNMKRIGALAAAFALTAFAACTLAGCGASLDREVTVQDITFKVPKTWLESPGGNGSSGAVVFTEDNEGLDEDETGNSLTISYEKLAGAPTAAVFEEAVEEQAGTAEQEGEVIEEEGAMPAEKAESAKPVARTAAEAIAAKQADLEKKYGITAWSIDKEKSKVIDGAQVTVYEYSFVKDIEGQKRKYESKTAYVVTTDTLYEIAVVGDKADINGVVDSIEL